MERNEIASNPCDMCHETLALLIIAIAVLLRCVPERVLELLHVVLADYDPAKLLESCGQVARCILATQDYTCTTKRARTLHRIAKSYTFRSYVEWTQDYTCAT